MLLTFHIRQIRFALYAYSGNPKGTIMGKVITRISIGAILLGGGLALGTGANPAGAATIRPATATDCSWVGTLYNRKSEDPHYYGFKATCTDTPASQWRIDIVCTSYGGTSVPEYGYIVTGSGSSAASCPSQNYEVDGISIENIS
jgi:hypothetical protein